MRIDIAENDIPDIAKDEILKRATLIINDDGVVKTSKPLPGPDEIMAFALGLLLGLILGSLFTYGGNIINNLVGG